MSLGYLQFFQKTNKNQPIYYGTSGRIVFVHFLEELKTTKRHFEINRPLDAINKFQKHTTLKYKDSLNQDNISVYNPFETAKRPSKFASNHRLSSFFSELWFSQNFYFSFANCYAFADDCTHGLRTPGEEIAFTLLPKIHSHSQIFRCGRNIFCLPYRPKFSDFFDFCLHWVSVVRAWGPY